MPCDMFQQMGHSIGVNPPFSVGLLEKREQSVFILNPLKRSLP